jgi:hypothetical protein
MRPFSHLVVPWLLVFGLLGAASPAAAQVTVGGHLDISIGAPGPLAQPYPAPGYRVPAPGDRGWASPGARAWAFEAGYEDGRREGFRDGRRGRRYDPSGQRDFRRATRGYHRDDGPRSFYQEHYRHGFRRGYEHGYREGAYGNRRHGTPPRYR